MRYTKEPDYKVHVNKHGSVSFSIGVQSFTLETNCHAENPDFYHAEYMARMLRIALGKLVMIPPVPQYGRSPVELFMPDIKGLHERLERDTQPGDITWDKSMDDESDSVLAAWIKVESNRRRFIVAVFMLALFTGFSALWWLTK